MSVMAQIRIFLETLAAEKGYSSHTLRAYRHNLLEMTAFVAGDPDGALADPRKLETVSLEAVDTLEIRRFLAYLHRRNQKPTIARKLAAIRSFFGFLHKHRIIDENPVEHLTPPKHGKFIPSYLPVDDMFRMLDSVQPVGVLGLRNKAMIETLYSTGVRVSELAGLDVGDLDGHSGLMRVLGKGSKERLVPIGAKAIAAIDAYREALTQEHGVDRPSDGAMFLNKDLGRLTTRSIARVVDQLARACGLAVPVSRGRSVSWSRR